MYKCRVASMFAGIGGICLGFCLAGYEIVWANELNPAACRTYRHNFGGRCLVEENVCKIDPEGLPNFDVLTAGFPCQSFSIGGGQKGFGDNRGALFFEVVRFLCAKKPKVVFLENVENLVEHDSGRTFLVIYNSLAALGYAVRYQVMPTYEYGNLPQARKRIYIVAFSDYKHSDSFTFPEPIPLKGNAMDLVNPRETKNDVYYYSKNSPMWQKLIAHIGSSQKLFRVYKGQVRNVRNPHLCPTLTASMCDEYNAVVLRDTKGLRRLTLREALDLQGFPQKFYFPSSISLKDGYRQIGNSVSVPVVQRIAEAIRSCF